MLYNNNTQDTDVQTRILHRTRIKLGIDRNYSLLVNHWARDRFQFCWACKKIVYTLNSVRLNLYFILRNPLPRLSRINKPCLAQSTVRLRYPRLNLNSLFSRSLPLLLLLKSFKIFSSLSFKLLYSTLEKNYRVRMNSHY